MNKVNHVIKCLDLAEKNISKLNDEVLSVSGETGRKCKHFLNNVIDFNGANHLEIGVKFGATLTASLFKNNPNSSYAIDVDTNNIDQILGHKKHFNIDFKFINEDCFKVDLSMFKHKINVYLFDGGHTFEDHYKALEYYYPILDDEFIYICDDWLDEKDMFYPQWKQVVEGSRKAFNDMKLKVVYQHHKKRIIPEIENWWGGYWVGVLRK